MVGEGVATQVVGLLQDAHDYQSAREGCSDLDEPNQLPQRDDSFLV